LINKIKTKVPEIHRLDLQEICLSIKSLNLGDIKTFLNKAIEPPNSSNIDSAINKLKDLQVIFFCSE